MSDPTRERIEAALMAIQKAPSSVYDLVRKTGFSHSSMSAAILKLVDAGKIEIDHKIKTGGQPIKVYRAAQPKPARKSKALPITIPQYRWWSTRLG